jgi:5S rRNA maturation endonuclease (ribonuclease M5)
MTHAVELVLERLEEHGCDPRPAGPDKWQAHCPCHDDRKPSLSVGTGDSKALLHCQAGCDTEEVVHTIGLAMADLFDQDQDRLITDEYNYTDEAGEPLFQVVRYAGKDFRQRRRTATGWRWKLDDTRRVLYRLPRIVEAVKSGRTIYVAEGEKDVNALERAGEVATCNPMGAGPDKWRSDYTETLRGAKEVVIVADRDSEGEAHARQVAAALTGAVGSVEIVQAKEGKDAYDHLRAGHGLDEFEEIGLDGAVGGYTEVSSPPQTPIPRPLREAAFHGLAGEFVRTIEPHTEADPAAVLIQFLAAFGNACGRGPGWRAESTEHGTNEFVGIVGATSKARKGTSWDRVCELMRLVDPESESRIASGIASGEGLIHAVRDPVVIRRKARTKEERDRAGEDGRIEDEVDPGVSEKRLLVVEQELTKTLRVMQRERSSTVSDTLRGLWDSGNARNMSKGSPERTTGSLVTLIGHITVRELRRELTEIEVGNGFGNRWLWVYAQRSKLLPRGGNLTADDLLPIARKIGDALRLARTRGMLDLTEEAGEVWDTAYEDLSEVSDDLFGAVTARAEVHVRRLAVLYALLDEAEVVNLDHLRAAIAVWDYCEASAAHIFGGKVGDPLMDKILDAIRGSGEAGLTRTKIRDVVGGKRAAEEIDAALRFLTVRGLVTERVEQTSPKGGPRTRRYTPEKWSQPRGPVEPTSGEGGLAPPSDEVSSTFGRRARGCSSHRDDPRSGCRYCQMLAPEG